MAVRKLRVAISGLGWMGKRHAKHFLEQTSQQSSSPPLLLMWQNWLGQRLTSSPYGVKLCSDYDIMLQHAGLEAVVVLTVTTVHAEQAIKAIEKDLHVLCEKPLSTSVEIVRLPI